MPRIRTLKPDHRLHRKVGTLDDTAYRLWVGMILEADDDGRLVAEPAQLKALVFGLRPQSGLASIERALSRLNAAGLIRVYSAGGTQYVWFPSWKDHQRISHPIPSKLPVCPDELERMVKVVQKLPETSRVLTEDSTGKGSGREGKGREVEGKGVDGANQIDFQSELERLRPKHLR